MKSFDKAVLKAFGCLLGCAPIGYYVHPILIIPLCCLGFWFTLDCARLGLKETSEVQT